MLDEPRLTEPLELFYSYSHRDEDLRDQLETHLSMLKRQKVISQWHDRGIVAGEEWGGEIDEHLESADIILLLISANFLASDYCYDIELELAMRRHEDGEARVIPVILRPCDWSGAPFGKLQALPKNAKPVTTWSNQDEAFTDIAKGIRRAAEGLVARRRESEQKTDAPTNTQVIGAIKAVSSNIPRPPVVGFVARRDEQGRDIVGRLREELAPENIRLVALWGPGGSGKTTLAAEFVRDIREDFKGRVAWVSALGRTEFSLATLLDEVATKLGREDLRKLAPEAKAAQVAALVSGAPALVVLDNFETVAEEKQSRCLDFLSQHAACPALITTRGRVNRDDVYNAPLAAMTMEEARDFLSRLVERTRKPSNFDRLDRDDLIRRCEANPLLLQWVVRQIDLAKRPQDVLDDLARGEGDAAERVFTRSYNLPQLGDDGRAALLALSLFTPDASREALAEVAGFGDNLRRLDKAVENLSSLWLVETTEGNERLFLRGLTRELADSRLSKEMCADRLRRHYVVCFLRHAEAHARPTAEHLTELEAEKDNLLSAMDIAFGMRDWESVMAIRITLNEFFELHGYWDEAVRSGEQAEAAAMQAGNNFDAATFKGNVAVVYKKRGEDQKASRVYREVIEVFRKVAGAEDNVAAGLHQLGWIMQDQGEVVEARKLHNESLEIQKKLGNRRGIAISLHHLAMIAHTQNELEESRRLFAESLEISKVLDDQIAIAATLHQLGNIAGSQGDVIGARKFYDESLKIGVELGNLHGIADVLYNLGLLELKEGNKAEAMTLLRESMRIYVKLGLPDAETTRRGLEMLEKDSVG